jgi:ABC-type transporter Mla MlaB component
MEERRDGLLTLRSSYAGSAYRMTLSGKLELENVECLAAEIARMEDSGAVETAIDLSQLESIDPSGRARLAEAGRRFRADGRDLRLLGQPRRFSSPSR